MLNEQQIQAYVEEVFYYYDRDRSGALDVNELAHFFNDVYAKMGIPNRIFNQQQAMQAMQAVDKNYDGRADRMEVYLAVRQTYGSFWQQNPNYQPVYPQQQAFHYQQNPGYQQMQPYQPKTVIIKSNQGTHVIMGNQPQYNPYQGY